MPLTSSRLKIRPAGPGDAAALARVYGASAEHHFRLDPSLYSPPTHEALVRRYQNRLPVDPDAEILVADLEGEVVGWLEIQLRRPDGQPRMNRDATTAEIDIAVLAEHRGQGIGTRLMRAAEDWALERGAEFLTLETHVANVDAIRFYQERHGWRTTGLFMMKRPQRDS
jgi:GNAT superfamily N-acetyltransferase